MKLCDVTIFNWWNGADFECPFKLNVYVTACFKHCMFKSNVINEKQQWSKLNKDCQLTKPCSIRIKQSRPESSRGKAGETACLETAFKNCTFELLNTTWLWEADEFKFSGTLNYNSEISLCMDCGLCDLCGRMSHRAFLCQTEFGIWLKICLNVDVASWSNTAAVA